MREKDLGWKMREKDLGWPRELHLVRHSDTGYANCAACGHVLGTNARDAGYHPLKFLWVRDEGLYEKPPPGYYRCGSPPPAYLAPDRRNVRGRGITVMGLVSDLWREVRPANAELWQRIRDAIAPVCLAAGVDVDGEDSGLHLAEALLARPPAPYAWGVYVNPARVWTSHGLMARILWDGAPSPDTWPELVAPAAVALAVPAADWRRHPSALREACLARDERIARKAGAK